MRLGQIRSGGAVSAAIFEGDIARPIPNHTVADLIQRSEAESIPLADLAKQLASRPGEPAKPLIPIHPRGGLGLRLHLRDQLQLSRRRARHARRHVRLCLPRDAAGDLFQRHVASVRRAGRSRSGFVSDSKFTAPEPELALILGSQGRILGYTLANDVSAWDIERENALYLPQSKVYTACCALGPVIVTPDELTDPYKLEMTCSITRGGASRFEGSTSTARLHRKFETLTEYLLRANQVPLGSVLLTGTGIIVTEDAALGAGDTVTIRIPEIGELSNTAEIVG